MQTPCPILYLWVSPQQGDILSVDYFISIVCFKFRNACLDTEQVPLPMGRSLLALSALPLSLAFDSALSVKN